MVVALFENYFTQRPQRFRRDAVGLNKIAVSLLLCGRCEKPKQDTTEKIG